MTRWEVFKQDAEGRPHQAVGSVHAADAEGALLNARHVFARRPPAVSLWVAPSTAVHAWTAEQIEAGAGDPARPAGAEGEAARPAGAEGEAARPAGAEGEAARPAGADGAAGGRAAYLVFRKTSNRRSMTFVDHVGEVVAPDPLSALTEARRRFGDGVALAWWLVERDAVTASAPEDAGAWFEPARDKTYKQQSAYGSVKPGGARRDEAGR